MSEPFLAEIKMLGFNFAPRGWALCDGQILPIDQNQSLYSLLGTTYGGDARTNFALPDLRGRVPIHEGQAPGGSNHTLGSTGGAETHVLADQEAPKHGHAIQATSTDGDTPVPAGSVLGAFNNAYAPDSVDPASLVPLRNDSIVSTGGSPHNNMQPSTVVSFAIAIQGLFPSRN